MNTAPGSIIESVGVYLPPREVSTDEVVKGCARPLVLPLERLTGISSRRMAGETEFSFDLALKAALDCLAASRYGPADIDMVVNCNISHFDGPDEYSFEPCAAARLCAACGFRNALAFDITNACAGMFTGIYLADALIRAGAIRRAMVVSGEYITHLTQTAQKEIRGIADSRVPCLTLGDAGAAAIVDASADPERGFKGIGLYTMGAHSALCVAKVTEEPHGGAIMKTDMLKLANISITAFMQHAAHMIFQLGWPPAAVDHILPHQTSRTSLGAGSREVKRVLDGRTDFQHKVIENVQHRGNTATTSHFVALKDCCMDGRLKTGQSVVFGILASGITIGTAVHRFDDLPDRIREASARPRPPPAPRPPPRGGTFISPDGKPRIRIAAVGLLGEDGQARGRDTLSMLTAASENCLANSGRARRDVDVLVSSGVYRTDFLTEPALAALLAGALKMNDAPRLPTDKQTLAFDVVNGALGPLHACHLACHLIRGRSARTVMVAASEVENNAAVVPDCLRGVRETASAMILEASEDGETGFGAFSFRSFPEHARCLRVYGRSREMRVNGRCVPRIFVEAEPELAERFIDCIASAVDELLEAERLRREDVAALIPPQISTDFVRRLSDRLGLPRARVADAGADGAGDLFTSSLAYGIAHLRGRSPVAPGDIGLIVNVGSGIQVGCATYRF